ncbi:MAG: hypothetical protein ABIP93_12345 [Gemmatimonadaceae bacterium]
MSTADDTSAADPAVRAQRATQSFGRIVVVGGGCYGSYYVRQLGRAARAGAVAWSSLVVVDRDPACAVARLPSVERPPRLEIVVSDWRDFFAGYLASAAVDAESRDDAIVPSPLMPHLMADWLIDRARARWPERAVRTLPLASAPAVPWQRVGDDGTHYVSFAEWMCPINCIEPARCPETRGPRSWSLPVALQKYAESERDSGHGTEPALLFHCAHRAYGVGMIDVRDVTDADSTIAARGEAGDARFLVGTVSHCHGALRRVEIA